MDQTYADYEKVAANVIGKDAGNWFSVFLIDRGSNDGISVGMNVLADGGLAGIVTQVGPNYAKVRSIIDDNSNVSAKESFHFRSVYCKWKFKINERIQSD